MSQLPAYISITDQPFQLLDSLIKKWNPDQIAILVDENTRNFCLPKNGISGSFIIEIPSGEEHKQLETCRHVWNELTLHQCSRKSLMVNLGGGVIGDLGGFCAATYKRGIKFVNIPTTLLSQVDASIGGKLGIDFGILKNHIGLFQEPDHVIVDSGFLDTLPERELKSGYAELIKHSLIASPDQWKILIKSRFEELSWEKLIPDSIALKSRIVEEDPTETGLRKILNFGHTLGHAIESFFLHTSDKLLHGEAVAIGMILESHLSLQKGWIDSNGFEEISNHIQGVFMLPEKLPAIEDIMSALLQDKKNDNRGINFSLIKGIGHCEYDVQVTKEMIKNTFSASGLFR
ncbi:MAG: 3-dehydroquinate synthase [Cyclobacteriaceae bacterium]